MLTFSFYVKKKKKNSLLIKTGRGRRALKGLGAGAACHGCAKLVFFGHGVVSVGGSEEPLMVPAFISSPAHVTAQRVFS